MVFFKITYFCENCFLPLTQAEKYCTILKKKMDLIL